MPLSRKEEETENIFLSEFTVFERRVLRSIWVYSIWKKGVAFKRHGFQYVSICRTSRTRKRINDVKRIEWGAEFWSWTGRIQRKLWILKTKNQKKSLCNQLDTKLFTFFPYKTNSIMFTFGQFHLKVLATCLCPCLSHSLCHWNSIE